MELLNKLIQKLGKKGYTVDKDLSKRDIYITVKDKLFAVIRGFCLKIWLKRSGGLIFLGRHTKIRYCHRISLGKTISIGDNVEINALSKKGIVMGNNISIHRNTIIECTGVIRELGEGLVVGNNVGFAENCFIQVRGNVTIGSNVMFGPGVSVFSENHGFLNLDIPMIDQPSSRKDVVIEDDVWLGANSIILYGVTIGKGSIIAAGAVVSKDVPPFSVAAGVPARIIGSRTGEKLPGQ